jgi:replicative DNA helicase
VTDRIDRKLPADTSTERALIGSILILPEMLDEVEPLLRPGDFLDPHHQMIYDAILGLWHRARAVDAQLLASELAGNKWLGDAGGFNWIMEMATAVPTAIHAPHYAKIIAGLATRRNIIRAGSEVAQLGFSDSEADHIAEAERIIMRATERRDARAALTMRQVLEDSLTAIDKAQGGAKRGMETGYPDVDHTLGGLRPAELLILAARPSMGKTALATCIAMKVARNNNPVMFASLEMSAIDLGDRMLSVKSGVSLHRMRNGTISHDDRQKIVESSAEMASWPLFINDRSSQSISEIASQAHRMKRSGDLSLIVVDYLQLIKPADSRAPREQQVSEIARGLKRIAKDVEVPVLALCQLNRQAEQGVDNRPKLSHLRESGAIEQEADVVMFVHRPEYYATTDDRRRELAGQAELIIEKQRNGPIGDIKLVWMKESARFESVTARHSENYTSAFEDYNQADEEDSAELFQ